METAQFENLKKFQQENSKFVLIKKADTQKAKYIDCSFQPTVFQHFKN